MHTKTLSRADRPTWRSAYFRADLTPWLCAARLRNHVELPRGCTKVRLVSTPNEPAHENYWDIKGDGRLIGVRAQLTTAFQHWNQNNWEAGDRYVYLETVK